MCLWKHETSPARKQKVLLHPRPATDTVWRPCKTDRKSTPQCSLLLVVAAITFRRKALVLASIVVLLNIGRSWNVFTSDRSSMNLRQPECILKAVEVPSSNRKIAIRVTTYDGIQQVTDITGYRVFELQQLMLREI